MGPGGDKVVRSVTDIAREAKELRIKLHFNGVLIEGLMSLYVEATKRKIERNKQLIAYYQSQMKEESID